MFSHSRHLTHNHTIAGTRGLLQVPFKSTAAGIRLGAPGQLSTAPVLLHAVTTPDTPVPDSYSSTLSWLIEEVRDVTTYMLHGAAAAGVQGAQLAPTLRRHVQCEVQWDQLSALRQRWQQLQPSDLATASGCRWFTLQYEGVHVTVSANPNTVLALCPERLQVVPPWVQPAAAAKGVWVVALLALRDMLEQQLMQGAAGGCGHIPGGPGCSDDHAQQLLTAVQLRLREMQQQLSANNSAAWAADSTYEAWVVRWGSPEQAAAHLAADPRLRLGALAQYLPHDLTGVRAVNLMGSHGHKAVALALLGAAVTVVDVSPGNAAYARAVAAAAGVQLEYVVADVLQLPPDLQHGDAGLVLLELGVLHYFVDLAPLMRVAAALLAPGGRLLLREFHPLSTKLLSSRGKKHKASGNYFYMGLTGTDVAYSKYAEQGPGGSGSVAQVQLRQWGLGEVVTAVAAAGLRVERLVEEPGNKLDDAGIPKLFTLVATRPVATHAV